MKNNKIWLLTEMIVFICVISGQIGMAQNSDKTKSTSTFGGDITVTNNGISTIPDLSLGKPAGVIDLSLGKGKFSFEPTFKFGLEGKPWAFLFWGRYQLVNTEKFQMHIGGHPALSFKTIPISNNGDSKEIIRSDRYLAGELFSNYSLTKNIDVGMYYLYSYGVEKDITKNTHFLSFRTSFSNISLSDQFYIGVTPQIYYLKRENNDGFYFYSTLTLAKKNFPVSLSARINKIIETDISASKNFIWNVSLTYSFNNRYAEE